MNKKPNLVFFLADQLRASALSLYDETNIQTPHIDKVASEGALYTNAISNCPVCTPFRAMLITGRYPQRTGHVVNFVNTRYDEIGWGDIFKANGYSTGYVGKWHLHRGSFPTVAYANDYVPEGRSRLGFDYWRAYNFHMEYFNGSVATEDWRYERWDGYETNGLMKYVNEFIGDVDEKPFCLFVSPHQPHATPGIPAPDEFYQRLPDELSLPPNVPADMRERALEAYRHYLAMTLAVDEMVGEVDELLREHDLIENTIFVIASDHGTQMGSHGISPWEKKQPYNESVRIPFIVRWPNHIAPGTINDTLFGAQDMLPSFMGMCGMADEGYPFDGEDLSQSLLGAQEQNKDTSVFMMNFIPEHDYFSDGNEWRAVKTKEFTYIRWLHDKEALFHDAHDPYQLMDVSDDPEYAAPKAFLQTALQTYLAELDDAFLPGSAYAQWFDHERRVIHNASGPLPDPESPPMDWHK